MGGRGTYLWLGGGGAEPPEVPPPPEGLGAGDVGAEPVLGAPAPDGAVEAEPAPVGLPADGGVAVDRWSHGVALGTDRAWATSRRANFT